MNMNNMTRFLSKREKDGSSYKRDKSRDKSTGDRKIRPSSSESLLPNFLKGNDTPKKTADKDAQTQIAAIKLRLAHFGYHKVDDGQITYVLNSKHAAGDLDKAVELLVLFQQAVDGVIRPYDPKIVMKGSENREAVTCYLDSVLFAMFARLTSFEPILHNTFEDEPRRRLATLIRLWVNMLRSGLLIHTDITELIQEALKDCGWEEAALIEQQDTSEAFSFITETLQLPLLTLKMDIYHTGKEDDKDDHKLIQERLLEVAVPDETSTSEGISLENCLENYFNNRVEVRRHLERSNTLSSIRSGKQVEDNKETAQHIEVTELAWSSPNTPVSEKPSTPLPVRPVNRLRTDSIIRQRVVEEKPAENQEGSSEGVVRSLSLRKSSVRKEVLMPAWQFFNLLPWYNRTQPAMTDADVASHFANARPVLGICLKRYGWREDYTPFRKDTFIDIPTDTKVPHFVEDDAANGDGPLFGNFKLSLQSVICHRGVSVNAGHYISFIRAKSNVSAGDCESDQINDTDGPPTYSPERWLRHDDMANPRVSEVPDIKQALKQEMPYLLFYQVLPMHDVSPAQRSEPPAYADSGVAIKDGEASPESSAQPSPPTRASYFEGATTPAIRLSTEIDREADSRQSLAINDEARRGSVAGTEGTLSTVPSTVASNFGAISAPGTPNEETTAQRMSRAAQRFTRAGNRSRPTSSSGEGRLSSSITRTMNLMKNANINRTESAKSETVASEGVFTESRRGSIQFTDPPISARPSLDDNSSRPIGESKLGRVRSKRGRGRDKSKDPSEGETHVHGHRHSRSAHRLGKGKDSDGPDRECMIM